MPTRLYPPQLEGTLPAFYKTYNKETGNPTCALTIPFGLNRAVNLTSIAPEKGLKLRLRTASTNSFIFADRDCDA